MNEIVFYVLVLVESGRGRHQSTFDLAGHALYG